jgi:RND superfamily putative drug exporter
MFDQLGKFVARHWVWILAAWLLGGLSIWWVAPDWSVVSQDDDIKSFPRHFDSVVGHNLLEQAFPGQVFNSQVVVVTERHDEPLTDADREYLQAVAARFSEFQQTGELRDDDGKLLQDKYGLGEILTPDTPVVGQLLTSRDQHAALLVAPCKHTFMAHRVQTTVNALRGELIQIPQPPGLEVALTGSSGVGADLQSASDESLRRSLWVTIVLVLVILLAVYRSPLVAMIPLLTIGVSVVLAKSLMALLTYVDLWGFHFQVMKITEIFVVVVLFGAGTDYCLFLIARYREELEHGASPTDAIHLAIKHVGGALAASAATVVFGLGMMVFAEFGKIRYTGPAVGVSLGVGLVGALTLTPALLRLLGPKSFWPFPMRRLNPGAAADGRAAGLSFQQRFWESISHWLTRRPVAIWATSVAMLLPFAVWGTQLIPTYDFLAELDTHWDSKWGAVLLRHSPAPDQPPHFPPGTLGPLTILLEAPAEAPAKFGDEAARQDIAALTEAIRGIGRDQIAQVRSLTHPLGEYDEPANAAANDPGNEKQPPAAKAKRKRGQDPLGFLRGAQQETDRAAAETRRKRALEYYVGAEGRVTRLEVVLNVAPFSKESMELRDRIRDLVVEHTRRSGTTLSGARHSFAGITSTTYDLRKITQSDQVLINWLVILVVYLILVMLLRRPMICLYLMATVLFGYFATLGMAEGFFRLLHHWQQPDAAWLGLDWKVAFFLFIILVAVGEDYNILLMSRVMEEQQKWGVRDGVRAAVARTGGIITSCGIIMAGTFGSMATGTLAAVVQLGFALALGVLLDTFVVRPILVPAFLLMLPGARAQRGEREPIGRDQPESEPVGTAAS